MQEPLIETSKLVLLAQLEKHCKHEISPFCRWQGAHATPMDAHSPDVEVSNKANRYGYTCGITVNSLGRRFFDEGEAHHSYAKTGWAVLRQPGARPSILSTPF